MAGCMELQVEPGRMQRKEIAVQLEMVNVSINLWYPHHWGFNLTHCRNPSLWKCLLHVDLFNKLVEKAEK